MALVLTRSIGQNTSSGREKMLREIRAALKSGFEATEFRLHSLVETRRFRDVASAAATWLWSLISGKPLPLQTLLYSSLTEIKSLTNTLSAGGFDAIYIDSVRCQTLVRHLRQRLPNAHLVVDFDDLMSRRMHLLARNRIGLSLGFLRHLFPGPLRWLIEGPLSSLVVRYEAAVLAHAEREMVTSAQAVVLVSSKERDILGRKLGETACGILHAIPPPAAVCRPFTEVTSPYRFVFIGSDLLAQNRLSIDCLLGLWREISPAVPLHIYGRQQRAMPRVEGVHWHGFVADVSQAYTSGSILLVPCLLPGGIKTKVIEAWAYGCPVLGNPLAFEGLDVTAYPLVLPTTEWASHLREPERFSVAWASAARLGNSFVRAALSTEVFANKWRALMHPDFPGRKVESRDASARLVSF